MALVWSITLLSPGAQAQTIADITVGGIDYRITMLQGSFNSVQTATGNALTSTPWYTAPNPTLAGQNFANAYFAATTLAGTPVGAYSFLTSAVPSNANGSFIFRRAADRFVGNSGTSFSATSINIGENLTLFYATAEIVPEIDGGTLAKVLLILMTGYLWIGSRRRKKAVALAA